MTFSRLRILSVIFACSCSDAFAQTRLSESEATRILQAKLTEWSQICQHFPEGGFVIYTQTPQFLDFADSQQIWNTTKHLRALESASLIRIQILRKDSNNAIRAQATVSIRDDIDKSQLREVGGKTCIGVGSYFFGTIVKIDAVKGGKTLWDGAVVMATYSAQINELFMIYRKAVNLPFDGSTERKLMALVRYNPFNSTWGIVAADAAPVNLPDFKTSNVSKALQND